MGAAVQGRQDQRVRRDEHEEVSAGTLRGQRPRSARLTPRAAASDPFKLRLSISTDAPSPARAASIIITLPSPSQRTVPMVHVTHRPLSPPGNSPSRSIAVSIQSSSPVVSRPPSASSSRGAKVEPASPPDLVPRVVVSPFASCGSATPDFDTYLGCGYSTAVNFLKKKLEVETEAAIRLQACFRRRNERKWLRALFEMMPSLNKIREK